MLPLNPRLFAFEFVSAFIRELADALRKKRRRGDSRILNLVCEHAAQEKRIIEHECVFAACVFMHTFGTFFTLV